MKIAILTLTALALFSFNTDALAQGKVKAPKDKVLAGKLFIVEMTETTGKKVVKTLPDEISFKSEKLNSKFMTTTNHFPAALYMVDVDSSTTPPTATFISEGKNTEGEDIKWEGSVTGDDIEGTATISKKGKVKKEFAYTGALKVKGAKK